MCRFIESIRIENGQPKLLSLHQDRMDRSCQFAFGGPSKLRLEQLFSPSFLKPYASGLFKWRLVYDHEEYEISVIPYHPRLPKAFTLVDIDFDYALKFEDRSAIDALPRPEGEEVIMVRDGQVSDASIYNLLFYDGATWFTPQTPLLKGVMRTALLDREIIFEKVILVEDLLSYTHVLPINAMNPFLPSSALPIESIRNRSDSL